MLIITLIVLLVASEVVHQTILLYTSGLITLRLLLVTIDIVLFGIIALAFMLVKSTSERQ